jgi:hypothetical protein
MLNFPASPPRASGCAGYLGVIRLANTACCVSKLARNDGRKNLHPHSTHRNGRTNAAVSNVRSSTPFLRDRRTHPLRQLGQRGDGKLIDTAELPQEHSANESEQPLVGGGRTSSSTSSRDPTINPAPVREKCRKSCSHLPESLYRRSKSCHPALSDLLTHYRPPRFRPLLDVVRAQHCCAPCPHGAHHKFFSRCSGGIRTRSTRLRFLTRASALLHALCVSALSFFWLCPPVFNLPNLERDSN